MANKANKPKRIAWKDIRIDGGTQSRAGLNQAVVDEYAEAYEAGEEMPPMVVFYDGKEHWLGDGFHRHAAQGKLKYRMVLCEVRQGTRRDAVLHSVGANSKHGLRRTNEDKRRGAEMLLRDPEWTKWSDREIARRVGVDHKTVSKVREELVASGEIPQIDEREVKRGSSAYSQDTTRIGQKAPEWYARIAGDKWYSVNDDEKMIVGPFDNESEAQGGEDEGWQAWEGDNLVLAAPRFIHPVSEYQLVTADEYEEEEALTPDPSPAVRGEPEWEAGKFYPVNDKLKFIYDDPMDEGEIAEARLWYASNWYDFLRGEGLMSRAKLDEEGWAIHPGRRPAPGGQTEAGEAADGDEGDEDEQVPQEPEGSPEHDPAGEGEEGHRPATKYQVGMRATCPMCLGNPDYDNWREAIERLVPTWVCPEGHYMQDDSMRLVTDRPAGKTKYQVGMRARCQKCVIHYPGYSPIHDNWRRDPDTADRVVWICPHKHRIADPIMDIIKDEPPVEAGRGIVVPEKFGVILADPPWKYEYPTTPYRQMSPGEMAALPVERLVAEDCALFMWATWPMIRQALDLGTAWGFEYTGVAALVWLKLKSGLSMNSPILPGEDEHWHAGNGTWTQTNTEFCLLFTRGKPQRMAEYVHQVIVAPVRRHSQKPDEQYERIEQLIEGPYLELFAREKREGWFAWGDEIESDIVLEPVEAQEA